MHDKSTSFTLHRDAPETVQSGFLKAAIDNILLAKKITFGPVSPMLP